MASMRSATIEGRAFLPFREEIAHRAVQGARHAHGFAVARHERERAFDFAHRFRRASEYPLARRFDAHVIDPVGRRIGKVDDSLNIMVHIK